MWFSKVTLSWQIIRTLFCRLILWMVLLVRQPCHGHVPAMYARIIWTYACVFYCTVSCIYAFNAEFTLYFTGSLRDRLCASRKGGAGVGGWVHPKGANSMVVSGLRDRKVLVGTGRAISAVFGINGLRK